MQTELTTHMEEQALTHNILTNYKPPLTDNSYLKGNSGSIGEDKKGLFFLMGRIDKTVRYKKDGLEKLNKAFNNSKFNELLSSINGQELAGGEKLNTFNFFSKVGLLGQNGTINIAKVENFNNDLQKIITQQDIINFNTKHQIEGLEISKQNGQLTIEIEKENNIISKLDAKYINYNSIKI